MATSVVDHLVGMIASTLQNEASLLLGVHDELYSLRAELISIRAFLKDANTKQIMRSEGNQTWVSNVTDLAYQAEDIIDEFLYNMRCQQRGGHFIGHLHSTIRTPKYLWKNHQIAMNLQDVKKKLKAVHETKQQYNIDPQECSSNTGSILVSLSHALVFIKEEDVIGLNNESEQVKRWLIDQEVHQTVISVVGMGGSGKTTLVTKIYNNDAMKHCFDCYGWITVSQTYKTDDLLKSLIKDIHQTRKEDIPDLTSMDFRDLVNMLIGYLEQRRYLVVLDDVWDTNVWEMMSVALPQNQLGSRVIITTRNEDVGSFCPGIKSHILHIKPLNNTEAWELFSRKSFACYPEGACPKDLRKVARELVEKCQGLPLAIVTMGGLMSSKKSKKEWIDVYNSLNWQLSNNPRLEAVKHILLLSYTDLPYPLKHCFLYCCLFPEDYEIKRKRIIRLWIAEGFAQQDNRAMPRQVAESYLMELIYRNMLQVVKRNAFGRPKMCKMHDLLRELALSITEKEKFCTILDGIIATRRCENARRISIQSDIGDLESYEGMQRTRSLLVFAEISTSTIATLLCKKLKLVRLLDLENAPIDKLPDGLGTLFNLRYLNLKGTQIGGLPKSIKKLYNLETLDMRDTLIKELPKGIAKLENLQHLIMYRYNHSHLTDFQYVSGTRALFELTKLKKLEVMSFIEAEGGILRQLRMMTQLNRMGISNLKQTDEIELCSSIQILMKLRYLFLMAHNVEEFLAIDALESPPPYLHTLILAGKLKRVPHWFCSLENLMSLYLHWSRMEEDPLPHIAELPNLGRLALVHAYIGQVLHFSKGFTKLQQLNLYNFPNVTRICIEKEVMPDVQHLRIHNFSCLTALPQGIESLTKLEILTLPYSLRSELFKVQHVPNVRIW